MLALTVPPPPLLDLSYAEQALFAPGTNRRDLAGAVTADPQRRLYRFALDAVDQSPTVQFRLSTATTHDAALAIYDVDGNLLSAVDDDKIPQLPATETLTVSLASGQSYVLAVLTEPSLLPAADYVLEVDLTAQELNTSLALDPTSGNLIHDAVSGEDLLDGLADVDFYPLQLENAGASASIQVLPTTLDQHPFVTVFGRFQDKQPWRPLASGKAAVAGDPVVLNIAPPIMQQLTDGEFMLAVAPADFATAGGSYQISAAAPLLGPAVVTPPLAPVTTPPVLAPGITRHALAGQSLPAGFAELTGFRAAADGLASLSLTGSFDLQVGIYDESGSLLQVATQATSVSPLSLDIPVQAGAGYLLRIADVGNNNGGSFKLTVDVPYEPLEAVLNQAITSLGTLTVAPTDGASIFRLETSPNTDVLVFQVAAADPAGADPVAPSITIISPEIGPVTAAAGAGETLLLPLNISGIDGPFDVIVSGTSGSDPVTLTVGQVSVPLQLDLDDLPGTTVDLQGDASHVVAPGVFGDLGGLAFFNHVVEKQQNPLTTILAQSADALPLTALYQEIGGKLHRVQWVLPTSGGQSSIAHELAVNRLHAVAVFPLKLAGGGNITIDVDGPLQTGVGVGMVPDPPPVFPSQNSDPTDPNYDPNPPGQQWFADLSIRNVVLETEFHRHLWRTILPANMLENAAPPLVTFDPDGGLGATIEVIHRQFPSDPALPPTDSVLTSFTSIGGQKVQQPITSTTIAELQGGILLFRVTPLPAQLDDGVYSLSLRVETDNPHPFEVTEDYWLLGQSSSVYRLQNPNPASQQFLQPTISAFVGTIQDIRQNQLGDGRLSSAFTTQQPFQPGSVDIFRFKAVGDGPLTVRTVLKEQGVNTNLRLYQRIVHDGFPYLAPLTTPVVNTSSVEILPNFDWFPADRSELDAQTFLHQLSDIEGPADGWYYIIVKNQEATTGNYRIEVDAPHFPVHASARISSTTGGATSIPLQNLGNDDEAIRYVAVQVPDYHNGQLQVHTGAGQGLWDLDAFDESGQQLTGQVLDVGSSFTGGTFDLPMQPLTVYLRIKEQAFQSGSTATVSVNSSIVAPPGTQAPANSPANLTSQRLNVNPFGDGGGDFIWDGSAATQQFWFAAPSGPLRLAVQPQSPADPPLRWGVYVGGSLVAWDETRFDGETAVADSLWTEILLSDAPDAVFARRADCLPPISIGEQFPCLEPQQPHPVDFVPPGHRDRAYDGSQSHVVLVQVETLDGQPASGGLSLRVESGADKPLRKVELTINPLDGTSLMTAPGVVTTPGFDLALTPIVSGKDWIRLAVPGGNSAPVQLEVMRPEILVGATTIRYDLYDLQGNPLHNGTAVIPGFIFNSPPPKVIVSLPNSIGGGKAYYVQVSRVGNPSGLLQVKAKTQFASKAGGLTPPLIQNVQNNFPDSFNFGLNARGDASQTFGSGSAELAFVPFWVSRSGPTQLTAQLTNSTSAFVALYRGHVTGLAGSAELPRLDLVLLDYVNQPVSGQYQLSADLDAGLYAIRVQRSNTGNNGAAALQLATPPALLETLVIGAADSATLDPNFGRSDLAGLKIRDRVTALVPDGSNLLDSYRTRHMLVTSPSGSQGGLTALAEATAKGAPNRLTNVNEDRFAKLFLRRNPDSFFAGILPDSTLDPVEVPDPNNPGQTLLTQHDAMLGPTTKAIPGELFYVTLERRGLTSPIEVSASVPVPFSGKPDLQVLPIGLLPNNGKTSVTVNVTNVGYAPADPHTSLYRIRDNSKPAQLQWTQSEQAVPTLGPFGSAIKVLNWDPVTTLDQVEYRADVDLVKNDPTGTVEELNEENNIASRWLFEVDPNPPEIISFGLLDEDNDGQGDLDGTGEADAIWGRYVSGVSGADTSFVVKSADANPGDLYQTFVIPPIGSTIPLGGGTDHQHQVKFWKLNPTDGNNPNQYIAYALDRWGLESTQVIRTAQVVARPAWPSLVTFNKFNNKYVMHLEREVLNYNRTTNQLFNTSGIPFVGNLNNRILVEIQAQAQASLDPTIPVTVNSSTHAQVKVLGQTVFNETYGSSTPNTSQVQVLTDIDILPSTLEATNFTIGLKIVNVAVLNYKSPEITLFTMGIPGLAEISANLIVGLNAALNAGLSVAFDPVLATALGFARPTFFGVDITPFITIEGEAEVLGFLDIASLAVSIGLNIDVNVGLKAPLAPNNPVPFNQLGSHLGVELGGGLVIGAAAEILGIEVWSDDWTFSFGTVGDDVITWDEVNPLNNPLSPDASPSPGPQPNAQSPAPLPPPAIAPTKDGTALLGGLNILPQPQLVIDGPGGTALYVQVADPGSGRGNLHFSKREAGAWSSLQVLSQSEHVLNPALALTHDQPGSPAMVIYQAAALPDPTTATLDQYLSAQEIRWRYYDGTLWGAEQTLESNGAFDGLPAAAFNQSGQGIAAWQHNTSTTPLTDPAANDIMVSVWDATTHNWLPPTQLTSDAASDTRPSVHVTEDGTATVVWLRNAAGDSAAGKEVWFSQFVQGAWTPATALPVLGLPELTNGRIRQLAIGSAGADNNGRERLDVLIGYSVADPATETTQSRLVHRAAWADEFAAAAAVQQIADKANFSELHVLPDPEGGLLAYWQQSDGNRNDLYAAHLAPPGIGGSTWTAPAPLTVNAIHEVAPTLAIDQDASNQRTLQVLFAQKQPLGVPPLSPPPVNSDGLPTAGNVGGNRLPALPELSFTRPILVPAVQLAPTGSEVVTEATIANSGLAGTHVLIEYARMVNNKETLLSSRTVFLGPGRNLVVREPVSVESGKQTIQMTLTPLDHGGQEAFSVSDNSSSVDLFGAADLVVDSIHIKGHPPQAGKSSKVEVIVRNASKDNITDKSFVGLWLGDPSAPLGSGQLIDVQELKKLQAGKQAKFNFNWNVPANGGHFVLTAVADTKHQIDEAIEFNNGQRLTVSVLPDATIQDLSASLLNYSGMQNVLVAAKVRNLGDAPLSNVKAQLYGSRNQGPFELLAETVLSSLPDTPKVHHVQFQVDGLAGRNMYRLVLVDIASDRDWTNQAAVTALSIQGLPDLVVGKIVADPAAPSQAAPLALQVDIANTGIDDAEQIRVEVFAESPLFGRRLVGTTSVAHLPPLSQTTIPFDVDTTQLTGSVKLTVQLDRLDKILELSENNNTGSIVLRFASACEILRDGDSIVITGTPDDDHITISEDEQGRLLVTCDDRPAIALIGVNNVQLNTRGGNDVVHASLRRLASIEANLGDGDDHLQLSHLGQGFQDGSVVIHADDGHDVMQFIFTPESAATNMNYIVDVGGGLNVVDVLPAPAREVPRREGAGVGRRTVVQSWQMHGGNDDDLFRWRYRDTLLNGLLIDVQAGRGNDLLDAIFDFGRGSQGPFEFMVQGGAGNDDLRFTESGEVKPAEFHVLLDGGPGRDVASASRSIVLKQVEQIAPSWIVNTTDDRDDGACDAWHCSLREAINAANAHEGRGIIRFDIPGIGPRTTGPHTIYPGTALPPLLESVFVDGFSQPLTLPNTQASPGSLNSQRMVEINGSQLDGRSNGLVLSGRASRLRGLAVTGFGFPDPLPEERMLALGGIVLSGEGHHVVEGMYVGIDPDGATADGNNFFGIFVDSANNSIGGTAAASRNLISGNAGYGIHLKGAGASRNHVAGNLIGTDRSAQQPLGNAGDGVHIQASDTQVGGATRSAANVIAFNRGGVVASLLSSREFPANNVIRMNSIHSNQALGIDLSATLDQSLDGPTANDELDPDVGPNGLQNFPELLTAVAGTTTFVAGALDSLPDSRFIIDLYVSPVPDPSGFGEGARLLGSRLVFTDSAGQAAFQFILRQQTQPGEWLSATATRLNASTMPGETSEFSGALMLAANRGDGEPPLLREPSRNAWRNPVEPADVNGDGQVQPFDAALLLQNMFLHGGRHLADGPFAGPMWFWDASGDDRLTPLDVLVVVNRMRSRHAPGLPGAVPPAGEGETGRRHEQPWTSELLPSSEEAVSPDSWLRRSAGVAASEAFSAAADRIFAGIASPGESLDDFGQSWEGCEESRP
jgi:CSLREA domain-containing protein